MSNKPTIEPISVEEGNKMIAEFMGAIEVIHGWISIPHRGWGYSKKHYPANLKYHESWDWIMDVVEKINKIRPYDVIIYKTTVHINDEREILIETTSSDIIKAVWQAVTQFIQYLNQLK